MTLIQMLSQREPIYWKEILYLYIEEMESLEVKCFLIYSRPFTPPPPPPTFEPH